MLSFFGFGKSKAQEKPKKTTEKTELTEENKGIIGKYTENDFPVIMKFVNELPEKEIISRFPFLTIVSWKYDGSENNGMPLEEINKRMITLEKALENSMDSSNIYRHVYSRTGNNLKEFAYYSTSQNDFMNTLNKTLEKHAEYPIGIDFYEDKEWADFKKIIENFKE
jgi:Family of unknown function (DUF695)